MPTETSRIFEQMDPASWGMSPDVSVKVLEPEAFIERYIDIEALGDTVIQGSGYFQGLRELSVSPYDNDTRMHLWEILKQSAAKYGSDIPYTLSQPPKPAIGPVSREHAERVVRQRLDTLERVNRLDQHPLKKARHVARFLLARQTDFIPQMKRWGLALPELIVIRGTDLKIREVIIDQTAEENFTVTG